MPRNGSGTYNLPTGNPVVPGTVISSSGWANPTLNDIAAALTGSWALNGEGIPTANQSLGNFRFTNVANALNRNEFPSYGQVQDGQPQWLTVSGTDTILGTIAPGPSGYVAGQVFRFVAVGANTTAAVTLNINSLGAKNVFGVGIGSFQSGSVVEVVYDGTQFQAISVPSGSLIGIQIITVTGTYTPTPGTRSVVVKLQAAGGAGGGCPATGAVQGSGGAGGGSGEYAEGRFTTGFSGVTVTLGAAGVGASGVAGGSAANSSFGALMTCGGGGGGSVVGPTGTSQIAQGGLGGTGGTGGYLRIPGMRALTTIWQFGATGATFSAATGANSILGFGGADPTANVAGVVGSGFGSGGSGTAASASQSARTGGNGAPAICIIYEYA